jgi:shikimate dehydrogenase
MGAVNTVVVKNGKLIGHNTDGSGWAWAFRRRLPDARLHKVVQLGAGGAGSAVSEAVLRLGAQQLLIVDSDADRARSLAQRLRTLHPQRDVAPSDDVAQALAGADGLIHCTPTGMDKLPGMPLPAELLRPDLWVSEIVYFPLETALLRAARAKGCPTVDGGGMAVGQAFGAFKLFTGLEPDATRMEAHFHRLIAQREAEEMT